MKFLKLMWKKQSIELFAERQGDSVWIHYQGQTFLLKPQKQIKPEASSLSKSRLSEEILSPMPGRIQKIFFKKQDKIKKGDTLFILSAMKIEYALKAEADGLVKDVFYTEGQVVEVEARIMQVKYV